MRLLVTNDDGIDSEGIHALARHLNAAGHEVVVVAPARDCSGMGAALGLIQSDEHVDVDRVEIPGSPDIDAWAVDGPPALTVILGRLGGFGDPPDAIVSGINAGLNTGRSILHSATVGAVLAGQNFGLSGLAVSLQSSDPWEWDTAAGLAVDVVDRLSDAPLRSVLNLNVPALAPTDVRGVRWARLGTYGAVRSAVSTTSEGRLQFELVPTDYEPAADSDNGVIADGYASLTTLVGIVEAWPTDEDLQAAPDQAYADRLVPGADLHPVHRIPHGGDGRSLHRPDLGEG